MTCVIRKAGTLHGGLVLKILVIDLASLGVSDVLNTILN
ncbi:hypothetical protein OTSANNIE_1577 [Anaplasma phagocytophilum str. Annie]|nr:hypothetical protein OTSANNIE_1577 [Anaplasma phagocytophilum str. Annie]